ncbi:MAG TPA: hypothetical protein VH988_13440 [Thermoanaerobaculia bacterium]|nr:hypothetical protein [Thermoanaerobaculia bacterium]
MRIGFVYDVSENVFATTEEGCPIEELKTELFSATQANTLVAAMKQLGHEVIIIDGAKDFAESIATYKKQIDFVFNEAKGLFGIDRKMAVPALCRIYRLPYLGSDAYTVTLARNKWHTLAVAAMCGILVPESALFESEKDPSIGGWSLFPAIVKPNFESASIGITDASIVRNTEQLLQQVQRTTSVYQQPALVQQFIMGTEIQVSLVGTRSPIVLPVVEIRTEEFSREGYSFIRNQDWIDDQVDIIPYDREDIGKEAGRLARIIYQHLGIHDYGRVDFRIDLSGRLFFIEAATHPHLTLGCSFQVAAQLHGWLFIDMLSNLIESASQRHASVGASGSSLIGANPSLPD